MRTPGWEKRLRDVERAYRARPHDWKTNNCAQFADACVAAQTGKNVLAPLAFDVHDADSARTALAARGFSCAGDLIATLFAEIAPARAQRGDVGTIDDKGNEVIVVVMGSVCAAPMTRCLGNVSRLKLKRAFRVG